MKKSVDIGLGIDCGTSGVRAVALTSNGDVLTRAQTSLVTQTPMAWWQATMLVMDELCQGLYLALSTQNLTIGSCAISYDATSSTVFLTNQQGKPISDVQMYYQSQPELAQALTQQLSPNSGAVGASSSLIKVLALIQDIGVEHDWIVCHQADWIGLQLTGMGAISDENNVLKLGYDVLNRCWPAEILSLIPESRLPRVLPPATPFALLLPELALRWQLPVHTQVATGTTDSIAAFLATKANRLGDAVISLGSTLAFKLLCERPYFDSQRGIYSHRLWDQWLIGGASNAGGAVLLEQFGLGDLIALSREIDIERRQNLDYYPLPKQAKGERFPMSNPNQQPKLTPRPAKDADFLQAMLESLVTIEQQGWQNLEALSGQAIHRLFTCGGGTKNPAWAGLRAAQLPYPTSPSFSQEAAVGSALLALRSLSVQLA
jgi:hypothetical protein